MGVVVGTGYNGLVMPGSAGLQQDVCGMGCRGELEEKGCQGGLHRKEVLACSAHSPTGHLPPPPTALDVDGASGKGHWSSRFSGALRGAPETGSSVCALQHPLCSFQGSGTFWPLPLTSRASCRTETSGSWGRPSCSFTMWAS